jgi:signal transduction histidine kinase
MSHELRTPLNAIIGFAQLLQTDPLLVLGARERSHLDEIVAGGRHLLALINELLDFGRIESGHLVVEDVPVPLAALIDECLGMVRALAEQRGLRLLPAPDTAVRARLRGDRLRIK